MERIHESNSRDGLATAIMEHANTLVSLASTLYALQRFPAAMEAYEQSLVVFELVEDVDRITKVLLNMHNMAELQVRSTSCGRGGTESGSSLVMICEWMKAREVVSAVLIESHLAVALVELVAHGLL